jgi:hypothetical protein
MLSNIRAWFVNTPWYMQLILNIHNMILSFYFRNIYKLMINKNHIFDMSPR